MSYEPRDWSSLSYKEVVEMLENYRSDYIFRNINTDQSNVKIIDETK